MAAPTVTTDTIIATLESREWPTADLVRINHAVAGFGKNATSVLGQYGEELVAGAFGGTVASFDQKAYDVRTPNDGDLQVKTFSAGKMPGGIRSFEYDVVTVEVDPTTATVISARWYAAADLFEGFRRTERGKHLRNGDQSDRIEPSWRITRDVPPTDITHLFTAPGAVAA